MQITSTAKVYRFKFSDTITSAIYEFAKLHQYDDRSTYKEAWKEWIDTCEDELRRENERLMELGYVGNVETKMYRSGRYYFRMKSTDEPDPKERRTYVSTSTEMIDAMDSHIKMHYRTPEYTPAIGYDDFCKTHKHILLQEITDLKKCDVTDPKAIGAKIKKTYKNRYFQFIRPK